MTRRARITIVTPYYAPEHSGTAPYVTAIAEHLSAAHSVTVLTGLPHYPEWRVAEGYRHWRMEERQQHLRVIRLRHYVPGHQSALRRAAYEATFATRALTAGASSRSDVVLAFTPPVLSTAAAAALASRWRAALGIIVHDLAGVGARESGMPGGQRVAKAVAALEAVALQRAAGIVVLHDGFRGPVATLLGSRGAEIRVIRNWTHLTPASETREDRRAREGWGDETVVLHTGNMGLKQGLENVVAAARLADRTGAPARFVLMGNGNQRAALEQAAGDVSRISFRDPVAEGDYPAVLAAADVLLVNERAGVGEMSVPSKLTSYFTAGRPVLAATQEGSPTATEMAAAGAGPIVPSGDPQALLDAVLSLRAQPERGDAHGRSAQAFAREHFSAEAALRRYSDWVDTLLDENPSPNVGGPARW